MYYVSTRNRNARLTAAEAIAQGLAADGGLLIPEVLPKLAPNGLKTMTDMSYQQRAVYVMGSFLDDFTASELSMFASRAYGKGKFDTKEVAPVREVDGNTYCLELWHGPTCAFKDMALQMLPHLLSAAAIFLGGSSGFIILHPGARCKAGTFLCLPKCCPAGGRNGVQTGEGTI